MLFDNRFGHKYRKLVVSEKQEKR